MKTENNSPIHQLPFRPPSRTPCPAPRCTCRGTSPLFHPSRSPRCPGALSHAHGRRKAACCYPRDRPRRGAGRRSARIFRNAAPNVHPEGWRGVPRIVGRESPHARSQLSRPGLASTFRVLFIFVRTSRVIVDKMQWLTKSTLGLNISNHTLIARRGITDLMRSPDDKPWLTTLLPTWEQVVAKLGMIGEELAEDPGHRSTGTLCEELLCAIARSDNPILQFPSLSFLALFALLMLFMGVVCTSRQGSEAHSKTSSNLLQSVNNPSFAEYEYMNTLPMRPFWYRPNRTIFSRSPAR